MSASSILSRLRHKGQITEEEYLRRLENCVLEDDSPMTESDVEDLRNAMNSMSYSEFQKFKK